MTELDSLSADVELGEAARAFVESDLGKCILGMAHQEIQSALEELETAKPTDAIAIIGLQNKAWRARTFEQWLCELVDKGNTALEIFKHERDQT